MKKSILLALLGAFCAVGCQPAPAPSNLASLPPTPAKTFIDQMRQKYNGDASKLTPEERSKMDEITHGHSDIAMKVPGK